MRAWEVDRFGYATDQESKTVRVYLQAGIGIFIFHRREISRVSGCQRQVQRA